MDAGFTGECWSSAEAGKVITYAQRDSVGYWSTSTTTLAAATTVGAVHVNGWIFASPTDASYCSGSAAAAAAAVGGSGSLSPGATAGIAVGAVLGSVGLATLGAGVFLIRRARQERQQPTGYAGVAQAGGPGGAAGVGGGRRWGGRGGRPAPLLAAELGSSSGATSPTYHPSTAPYGSGGAVSPPSWVGTAPGGGGGGPGSYTVSSNTGGGGSEVLAVDRREATATPQQQQHHSFVHSQHQTTPQPYPTPQHQQQQHHQGAALPVEAMEMAGVTSPVLHPGDLQPQGYGPGMWKPGPVYR
jgi:hypothetical protein